MSVWQAKRFWSSAVGEACEGGFTVRLDARLVKTPARRALILPTLAMAQALAVEWDAQQGLVNPNKMPLTRAANSAIDKVAEQFAAVADQLAAYAGTDLLCYRAVAPEPLIARQAQGWGAVLDWAASALDAPLTATAGVMHIAQPDQSLKRLSDQLHGMTAFQLAAAHDLIAISGSLVLALAVVHDHLTPIEAWQLSRIDETWQNEQWGIDEDAAQLETLKQAAFFDAARFYTLCG